MMLKFGSASAASAAPDTPPTRLALICFVAAMALVVTASNVLVQYPFAVVGLRDWLTWGAWTYPIAFLITDLCNRTYGPARARLVVVAGFCVAVALSAVMATPRIALASGVAFATAQLLDVSIFHRLRAAAWWKAPAVSSVIASTTDTALFFSLAFAGEEVGSITLIWQLPTWVGWAMGDLMVKLLMILVLLLPYRHISSALEARSALVGRACKDACKP